jgi:hypothetical protein
MIAEFAAVVESMGCTLSDAAINHLHTKAGSRFGATTTYTSPLYQKHPTHTMATVLTSG